MYTRSVRALYLRLIVQSDDGYMYTAIHFSFIISFFLRYYMFMYHISVNVAYDNINLIFLINKKDCRQMTCVLEFLTFGRISLV